MVRQLSIWAAVDVIELTHFTVEHLKLLLLLRLWLQLLLQLLLLRRYRFLIESMSLVYQLGMLLLLASDYGIGGGRVGMTGTFPVISFAEPTLWKGIFLPVGKTCRRFDSIAGGTAKNFRALVPGHIWRCFCVDHLSVERVDEVDRFLLFFRQTHLLSRRWFCLQVILLLRLHWQDCVMWRLSLHCVILLAIRHYALSRWCVS